MQQSLEALAIYSAKHTTRGLTADLQAKRSTAQTNENRSTPALYRVAGNVTVAILSADNESPLFHSRNYADADCLFGNTVRDRFVRRGHDLLNYGTRVIDPGVQLC